MEKQNKKTKPVVTQEVIELKLEIKSQYVSIGEVGKVNKVRTILLHSKLARHDVGPDEFNFFFISS